MNRYDDAFHEWNNSLLFARLRMTSIFLLLCYPVFLYVDLVLLKDVGNPLFLYTLTSIHTSGFIASLILVFIYQKFQKSESFMRSSWPHSLIILFVAGYVLASALSSLNSHRLSGNIDAYVVVLIGVAAVFPLRPRYFAYILVPCHLLFLYVLAQIPQDDFSLHAKQINTSMTVCISFFIVLAFHSYRKKEFNYKREQKESAENLRKLFDINPYPLLLSRLSDGRILLMNERAQKEWPCTAGDEERYDTSYVFQDAADRQEVVEQLRKTGSIKNHVLQQKSAPGFTRWAMVHYEVIEYDNIPCILSGMTDITELKKVESELAKHASIDLLTGQLNRRSGIEALQQIVAESRSSWISCTICFVDINNLKQVNDQYGHREGDALITTVCDVIRGVICADDILFRYGGDEFIILFTGKSQEAVEALWDVIWQQFLAINAAQKKPYLITASHGLFYFCSGMDVTIEDMIEQADAAMYKEKTRRKKELSDMVGGAHPLV
ncbi:MULTISPECIES: sensor domain-containing diguanylate cyclase [Brevibacillus]|uniref:sensor domain-containing diguanylate cyclase n=1 Tax=Brevibacillus TaxID=55080 RepID=UPI001F6222C9|nr:MULTISPECIES: diguanylate cyclase [Brevibacillus]MDH6351316.1 diguanylate cyclase (GGDEF)-like protein [Brevibacillus sp. 1238]